MAALVTVRPGPYTATWNSVALGITTSDGWKLRYRKSSLKINNTNLYGDTLIDGIYRGISGVQLLVTLKEWNAGVQAAIWPWCTASPAVFDGTLGQPMGTLDTTMAKALVLTAVANTPAAGASSGGVATANTLTGAVAILAPENDIDVLFGPVETDIPLLFDLLLYDDSGVKRFFKWSSV